MSDVIIGPAAPATVKLGDVSMVPGRIPIPSEYFVCVDGTTIGGAGISYDPLRMIGGGGGGFPVGGTLGAPLLSRGAGPSAWSTNNFLGDATVVNLDPISPATVRYNYRPQINPIGIADETTAIYIRLGDETPGTVFQYGLYIEIPSTQNYTDGGAATKVIHRGHGDAHYVALLNGISAHTITAMTGSLVSPIVCTVPAHGFGQGDDVQIAGAVGNTAANGVWFGITVLNANQFSLPGSTGNGAYTPSSATVQDINSPVAYEAAAYGDGTVGFLSSMQHTGGRANWQGFVALYQQNALLNYAAFNADGMPNKAFSVNKQQLADATIDGLTQYEILEASPRLKDGDGVPGGNFTGGWNPATAYEVDDTVISGTAGYAATAPNTNDPPPSANWTNVTDTTNDNRLRIGLYNNGDAIQSALKASAGATLLESPEHRYRATYWDGATSHDLDAVLKYVPTATTPAAEFRIYLGPSGVPQLSAVLRPNISGTGGNLDLQTGILQECGGITAAAGGMPIDQIGGAISNCGGLSMKAGGGAIDLQGGNMFNCVNIQSNTALLAFAANATFYLELSPPGGVTEAAMLVYINGVMQRVSVGAADSGGAGFRLLRVAN